ncbi:MAG: SurA N-terminal domain-containing protein [Arthrobacter sp.]|uniref:SurA N-terminal domain-containing protein n=1 Tax=unclassified Arthrobacter TaxID=235627 RepID=UPI003FB999F1
MNKKKMLAALALVGSLSLVTACGSGGNEEADGSSAAPSSQSSEQAAAPSPDLKGIPDVVATVNDKDISKKEFTRVYESQFQQAAMQAQMSGQDLSDQTEMKKQVADGMVGTELLIQKARTAGVKATERQMDKALTEAAKSQQMDKKEFLAALKKQGMERKTVDKQIKQQVEVEGYIEKEAGPFEPSEKELKAAYKKAEDAQKQQGKSGEDAPEMPKYKDAKSQLKQQLVQQKENEATQTLVKKLRKDADVKINL